MPNTNLKALSVKVEVAITPENVHVLTFTPRETTPEALETFDSLFHAILTQQPKKGAYLAGSPSFRIHVKTEDLVEVTGT